MDDGAVEECGNHDTDHALHAVAKEGANGALHTVEQPIGEEIPYDHGALCHGEQEGAHQCATLFARIYPNERHKHFNHKRVGRIHGIARKNVCEHCAKGSGNQSVMPNHCAKKQDDGIRNVGIAIGEGDFHQHGDHANDCCHNSGVGEL